MANYYGAARTNYVRIEDMMGLEKSLKHWSIELVENDEGKYAFLANDESGWDSFALDDDDNEIDFDFATVIMPHVAVGEVLVAMSAGAEKLRYITGYAEALVRDQDGSVRRTDISLNDIYAKAATDLGTNQADITEATY